MASKSQPTRLAELAGAPPKLATAEDLESGGPLTGDTYMKGRSLDHKRGAIDGRGRINLRAVAEACVEEGLDPAVEIVKALKRRIPKTMGNGMPVLDENGEPVYVDAVDQDTKLRTLNELLQYTQPKLKAVEVKLNGNLELSSEQLDQRLASLIAKAAKNA
jgi:hypothetical protein